MLDIHSSEVDIPIEMEKLIIWTRITSRTQNLPPPNYNRNTAIWDQALSLDNNNSDFRFWQTYQYSSYFEGEGGVLGALTAHNLDALILPSDQILNR
jgi:hypothetical protein